MSILTVELPSALAARLEAAARAVPEEKARLVRVALEKLLEERERGGNHGQPLDLYPFPDGQTFGDVTKDVCGKYEGPGDLSTNPKYMEGFGED